MASFSSHYSRPWTREYNLPVFQSHTAPFNTIHSSNKRQKVYRDETLYGKLYKGKLHDNSPLDQQKRSNGFLPNETVNSFRTSTGNQFLDTQKSFDKRGPEIMQSARSTSSQFPTTRQTTVQMRNTEGLPQASVSARSKLTTSQSHRSISTRGHYPLSAQLGDIEFQDQISAGKYEFVTFREAGNRNIINKLKFDSSQFTILPNDQRKVIIEGIMRDFFLNLDSHNSTFIICKNKFNQDLTVHFTGGKVVPFCRLCNTLAYFELSQNFGFRVLCCSDLCSVKVLHHSYLKYSVKQELWKSEGETNFDQSMDVKVVSQANVNISKLIVSGKYKKKKLNEILKERPQFTTSTYGSRVNTDLKGSLRVLTLNGYPNSAFGQTDAELSRSMFVKPQSPSTRFNKTTMDIIRNRNPESEDEAVDEDYSHMAMRSQTAAKKTRPQFQSQNQLPTLESERSEFLPLRSFFEKPENIEIDPATGQADQQQLNQQQLRSIDQQEKKDSEHVVNNSFLDMSLGEKLEHSAKEKLNTSKDKDEARKDMADTIENIYKMMDSINE